jgi:O-methyltransferase
METGCKSLSDRITRLWRQVLSQELLELHEMISALRQTAHRALSPWLYRYPEPQLQADRLYLYLDTLYRMRDLPGAVVEVGCFQGGTAVYASRFLKRIDCERRYLCIDTFDGFPQSQFANDVELGTSPALAQAFSGNSESLVRKLLVQWDALPPSC